MGKQRQNCVLLAICFLLLESVDTVGFSEKTAFQQCEDAEQIVSQSRNYLPPIQCVSQQMYNSRLEECDEDDYACHSYHHDNECLTELRHDLKAIQFENCQKPIDAKLVITGFGNMLQHMVLQLLRAYRLNRTITWSGEFAYAACETMGISCAFEAFANCDKKAQPAREVFTEFENAWVIDIKSSMCLLGKNSFFRYVAALSGHLFKPRQEFMERKEALIRSIGLPERYLGLHVRHGDSCLLQIYNDHVQVDDYGRSFLEEDEPIRSCQGLTEYFDLISVMATQYAIRDVFIATDNPEVMANAKKWLPNLTFYWNDEAEREFLTSFQSEEIPSALPDKRTVPGEFVEKKLQSTSDKKRKAKVLEDVMIDVLIMRGCLGLVGPLTSRLSRFYLQIASDYWGRVIPYMSVDGIWKIGAFDIPDPNEELQ